jgi:hypothetical protein
MNSMQSLYSAAFDRLSSSSIDSNQSLLRLQIREQRRKTKLLLSGTSESHETVSSDINKELERLKILESRQSELLHKEESLQQPTIRDPSSGAGGSRLCKITTQNLALPVSPFLLASIEKSNVFLLSAFLWGFFSFDQRISPANFQWNHVSSDDESSVLTSDSVYHGQRCRQSAATEGKNVLLKIPPEIIVPVRKDISDRKAKQLISDIERTHRRKESTHVAWPEQSLSFASFGENCVPYPTHPFHPP